MESSLAACSYGRCTCVYVWQDTRSKCVWDFRAVNVQHCECGEAECWKNWACARSVKCVGDKEWEADGCLEEEERERGRREESEDEPKHYIDDLCCLCAHPLFFTISSSEREQWILFFISTHVKRFIRSTWNSIPFKVALCLQYCHQHTDTV